MARARRQGRYEVTGPGCEGKTYEDLGPALSHTVTRASASKEDGTWYVRDLDGSILGYSERIGKLCFTFSHVKDTK
jgi:hypothetical protein